MSHRYERVIDPVYCILYTIYMRTRARACYKLWAGCVGLRSWQKHPGRNMEHRRGKPQLPSLQEQVCLHCLALLEGH
jgi:hypothetical protein